MSKHPAATLSRKERDRRLRRGDFLRAAARLFNARGYHQTSMEDIAREAEYATGTLYRYFRDKEDLYITLMEQQCNSLLELLQQRIDAADKPGDKLAAMVRTKIEFFDVHRNFLRLYIQVGQSLDRTFGGRMSPRLAEIYESSRTITVELLRACMRTGAVREEDPVMLAAALQGLIENCLTERMASNQPDDAEAVFSFIMRFIFNGLSPLTSCKC